MAEHTKSELDYRTDTGHIEFDSVQGAHWLVDPTAVSTYMRFVYSRRNTLIDGGSILPLPLAKLDEVDVANAPLLTQRFDEISTIVSNGIRWPRLIRMAGIELREGENRPKAGWHVDREYVPAPFKYTYRFILSATNNPDLTTLYAPWGSRLEGTNKRTVSFQPEPDPAEVLRGSGNVVYLLPTFQAAHASPDVEPGPDVILLNRYSHFVHLPLIGVKK